MSELNALDLVVPGLGTAVGIGTSIYGGIKAGEERNRMAEYLRKTKADNESLFNKDYYTNYTERADTQALMKNLRDNLRRENKIQNQTAVVTGATPEAQLAAKEQEGKVVSDTTSNIAAMGQRWKDNILQGYQNRKMAIGNMEYGAMDENARSYEQLMGNGITQVGNVANGLVGQLQNPVNDIAQTANGSKVASKAIELSGVK